MSPYRLRKIIRQFGYALILILFFSPKLILLLTGDTTIGISTGGVKQSGQMLQYGIRGTYVCPVVSYQVNNKYYHITVSDYFIGQDLKAIPIIYSKDDPEKAYSKTFLGLITLPLTYSIIGMFIWYHLTDLFLKDY